MSKFAAAPVVASPATTAQKWTAPLWPSSVTNSFPNSKRAFSIDASPRVVDILNQRIKTLDASHIAEAVVGDYSDAAVFAASSPPADSLPESRFY